MTNLETSSGHTSPFPRSESSSWLTVALVAIHSIAALEFGLSLARSGPGAVTTLTGLLSHWAGSVIVVAALYVGLSVLIGLPLRLVLKLPAVPLAVAIGAVTGFPILLAAFGGSVASLVQNAIRAGIVTGLSLVLGAAVYLAIKAVDPTGSDGRRVAKAALITPFLLVETVLLLWLRLSYLHGLLAPIPLRFWAIFTVVFVAGSIFLFKRDAVLSRVALVLLAWSLVLFAALGWHANVPDPGPKKLMSPVSSEKKVRHVVLITVDTLRADALGGRMSPGCASPAIDRLASSGVRFEGAHAPAPWTLPSVASIMTGLSPTVHGVDRKQTIYPPSAPTLEDFFQDAGYLTAAFGTNTLLAPQSALSRGFDVFEFPGPEPPGTLAMQALARYRGPLRMSDQHRTEQITASAEAWIELHADQNFFVWLHYFDPHAPYLPPVEFLPDENAERLHKVALQFDEDHRISKFTPPPLVKQIVLREMYCGEVRYVDDRIGRLVKLMKSLRLYDDALIVLTSDHGEEFWERGGWEHGHSLYEELLKVPLFFKLTAGKSGHGTSVDAPVSIVRVVPTILDLSGIAYDAKQFSGGSLQPLWAEAVPPPQPTPIYSGHTMVGDEQESIVFGRWKYIRYVDSRRDELYHLAEDTGERMNVLAREPERGEELRALLKKHHDASSKLRERIIGPGGRTLWQRQEEMYRRMRSLGYIQ